MRDLCTLPHNALFDLDKSSYVNLLMQFCAVTYKNEGPTIELSPTLLFLILTDPIISTLSSRTESRSTVKLYPAPAAYRCFTPELDVWLYFGILANAYSRAYPY